MAHYEVEQKDMVLYEVGQRDLVPYDVTQRGVLRYEIGQRIFGYVTLQNVTMAAIQH